METEHEDFNDLLEADPDLQYLLPEEEGEGGGGEEGGEEDGTKSKPKRPISGEYEAPVRAEPTEDELERFAREKGYVRPTVERPAETVKPVTQEEINLQRRAFAKQLKDDFLTDPENAFDKFLAANERMINNVRAQTLEEARRELGGVRGSVADENMTRFSDTILNQDGIDDDIKKEYNKRISEARKNPDIMRAISGMTSSQLRQQLEDTLDASIGSVERKRRANKRRGPAPNMGGSSSSQAPTRAEMRLSEDEKGLISNLKSAGITDAKVIRQTLKEFREEKRAARA